MRSEIGEFHPRRMEKKHALRLHFVIGELSGPWAQRPGIWTTLLKIQVAGAACPEYFYRSKIASGFTNPGTRQTSARFRQSEELNANAGSRAIASSLVCGHNSNRPVSLHATGTPTLATRVG